MTLMSSLSIDVECVETVHHHVGSTSTPETPTGLVILRNETADGWSTVHLYGTPEQLADVAVRIYLAAIDLAEEARRHVAQAGAA